MNFFTTLPICPNCLNPLKGDIKLVQIKDNIFKCPLCGNKFRSDIVLDDSSETFEIVFPLFTEVKLNKIESAYVDWILEDIKGKYLVTWPWKNVEFLPILISEYLSKFEDKKIIVFTDLDKYMQSYKEEAEDSINNSSQYNYLLDSLYFLKNRESVDISNINDIYDENLNELFHAEKISIRDAPQIYCKIYFDTTKKKNFKKINKSMKKLKVTPIFSNLNKLNGFTIPCGDLDESYKIYQSFLEKFIDFYGKDLIKEIKGIPHHVNINEKKFTSKDGVFRMFFIRSNPSSPVFSVNEIFKKSYKKCMDNRFDLISFSDEFDYSLIESNEDIKPFSKNNQVFFINDKILSDALVERIIHFQPDLVIGTDIDHLFGKNRYEKGRHNQIYKLLRSDLNLLLFSTNLHYRHTYKIGRSDYYLNRYGVIPHTWDYKSLLNEIKNFEEYGVSFFSSHFDKIHGKKSNLEVSFCEVEELGLVESIFPTFIEVFDYNDEVKRALSELIQTPLYITGEYKDFRVINRILNFEYLISLIFEHDEEMGEEIRNVFEEVYNFQLDNPRNPILEKLIDLINNADNFENMVVIVHGWDKQKLRKIFEEKLGEDISNKILISSWSSLNKDLKERETPTYYGISTRFPTLNYDIYSCTLSKLDVICSPNNKKRFKFFLNNRFTEKGMKPIYLLSEHEDAPKLLKETLKLIDIPEDEDIEEFIDLLNKVPDGMGDDNELSNYKGTSHYYNKNISPNNNAILVLDDLGNGIFLPFNKTIYFIDENELIEGIELNNYNYNALKNKNILLNERETYLSLNEPFLEYVLENGKDIVIQRRKYQWKGFEDLINSMYKWVDILYQILEKEPTNIEENKTKLALNLSRLELSAGRIEYIEKNWLNGPKILDVGEDEVRIFDAERPKTIEDCRKIFEWIGENYKEFDVSRYSGDKTFYAARELQFLRRTFFRNKKQDLNVNMYELLDGFQDLIKGKISNSYKFRVEQVQIIKIKKEVTPYKILENYIDYI